MRKRTLLLFILLLLTPLFSAADDTDLLSQEYTLLAGRGNQASEIRYSRSEADIFMDSLTDVMREELVRSVLSENDEIILARMLCYHQDSVSRLPGGKPCHGLGCRSDPRRHHPVCAGAERIQRCGESSAPGVSLLRTAAGKAVSHIQNPAETQRHEQ